MGGDDTGHGTLVIAETIDVSSMHQQTGFLGAKQSLVPVTDSPSAHAQALFPEPPARVHNGVSVLARRELRRRLLTSLESGRQSHCVQGLHISANQPEDGTVGGEK